MSTLRLDMRSRARMSVAGLLTGAFVAVVGMIAPAAQASLGVSLWEAGTCVNHTCTYKSVEKNHAEAFTQAAGHPPWGITTFELASKENPITKQQEPEGAPLKRVRVDVPPGLASNPQAPQKCSIAEFMSVAGCPKATEVGTDEAIAVVAGVQLPATGTVYNLEPEPGLHFEPIPLLFGIAIQFGGFALEHSFLEGHVAWFGDYHEYFEINNLSKSTPILRSQLNFKGTKEGEGAYGNFITLPSECSSTTANTLEVESWPNTEGVQEVAREVTHTPVGVEGCDKVPFKPTVEVHPATAQSDQPDGATAEVKVPQHAGEAEINSSDVKDA